MNQKIPYDSQLLLQCSRGEGKRNKNPLLRVYNPKGRQSSHGLKQGAFLQSTKNFLCQGLPPEEGWFQAAGIRQEDFLEEKSTRP